MEQLLHLSKRGTRAFNTVVRSDFELYFEASQNLYHPVTNTTGSFTLNVADNKLNWEKLKSKLEFISATEQIPDWVSGYTSGLGHESFRSALAGFLSTFIANEEIDYGNIGIAAGATAVIEVTSMILADAGEVAVFPSPSYPVYALDINNKAGLERYDLQTHHEIDSISTGPILSIEHLEAAKDDIQEQGKIFRLLVLTNPDNPTGGVYSLAQLESISDWCIQNKIHLIVNEIYALATLTTSHPSISKDYSVHHAFVSILPIINRKRSPYIHQWYALSKDLGISGMRIGMVYSLNKDLIVAFNNLNLPHMVSNHTQWLIGNVLNDKEFLKTYLLEQQTALTESYAIVTKMLQKLSIPYVPSYGSLFVWADFSKFLSRVSVDAELIFWKDLYMNTGILLTPGTGFGHTKKGMFRIVYTSIGTAYLQIAMERLVKYLTK